MRISKSQSHVVYTVRTRTHRSNEKYGISREQVTTRLKQQKNEDLNITIFEDQKLIKQITPTMCVFHRIFTFTYYTYTYDVRHDIEET